MTEQKPSTLLADLAHGQFVLITPDGRAFRHPNPHTLVSSVSRLAHPGKGRVARFLDNFFNRRS